MSHKFFQNKECEYFPCHKNAETNCIFCYCPLYNDECGGNYKILENGLKDCSSCDIPHSKDGYNYIVGFLKNNPKRFRNV